jgi:hypothetical protein
MLKGIFLNNAGIRGLIIPKVLLGEVLSPALCKAFRIFMPCSGQSRSRHRRHALSRKSIVFE